MSEEFLIAAAAATIERQTGAHVPTETTSHGCHNCSAALAGPFCHACGQKQTHLHKPIWELVEDFLHSVLHFDGRMWQTLRALFVRPGQLTLDWIEGRQMRHVPPIRLFIFTTLLLVLALTVSDVALVRIGGHLGAKSTPGKQVTHFNVGVCTGKDEKSKDCVSADTKVGTSLDGNLQVEIFQLTPKVKPKTQVIESNVVSSIDDDKGKKVATSLMDFANRAASDPKVMNRAITGSITTFVLLATPIMALLLKLFYIRKKKNTPQRYLGEHIYFALHVHTFFFAALLICILLVWASRGWLGGGYMMTGLWLAFSVYFLLALKRVYGQGWRKTVTKSMLVTGFYSIILFTAGTTLLARYVVHLAE
jgi:hypothetical protein